MASRFTNRYQSFCSSLESLTKAKERDPEDEFVLSGTVQKFNLTFDISWKVMKDVIVKYHKIQNFAVGSPRETLRTAYSVQLIENDMWMKMLETRNELTHDYDGELAAESFSIIINDYIPLFEKLKEKVQVYVNEI